jgi:N-acylneuraminate cytidylyltransferase
MTTGNRIVALIPARGGSKGLPRKNVRLLGGKPLIGYAIEIAQASNLIDRVIVSTDDAEIADVARQFGAEVPFTRPAELAGDNSPEWQVWQHAVRFLQAQENGANLEVLVPIPPTSPFRAVEDVDACIQLLQECDADMVLTVTPSSRSPYFNMLVCNQDGYVHPAIQPATPIHRRQDAPPVFDGATVAYAVRPEFVLNSNYIFEGKVKAVVVPAERALDIDTELDFKIAELMFAQSTQDGLAESARPLSV